MSGNKQIVIKIKVDAKNKKAAKHFLSWLCGSGEQLYWDWMECREQEEKGDITIVDFDYFPDDAKEFAENFEVVGTCGRLDVEDE